VAVVLVNFLVHFFFFFFFFFFLDSAHILRIVGVSFVFYTVRHFVLPSDSVGQRSCYALSVLMKRVAEISKGKLLFFMEGRFLIFCLHEY